MTEYIKKSQALMQLTGRFPNGISLEKYIGLVNFRLNGLEPADVISIPEGATNGDAIKVMFPNAIIEINELGSMVHVKYSEHTCWVNYELEWWNAPYKK